MKNLPYDCNEAAVREILAKYGEVRDVRLGAASGGGGGGEMRLKGFGYVQFASEVGARKSAEAAAEGTLVMSKKKKNFIDL